jgi:4-diphosphocytidyl-2-C-methyl-D-erythritol kinase
MISFPHAKINLGLSIVSKRPDGFHNLESIFYPVAIRDALEIVPSRSTQIILSGLKVGGNINENLVLLAYHLLKKKYPAVSDLAIFLHKGIHLGAGLGGGSSDAAGMILLMNNYFNLQISTRELSEYAAVLGSDCPFFLQSRPCFVSGRGEILEPVNLDLGNYSMLFIHPEIQIETSWAYSRISPTPPGYPLKESILQPIRDWKYIIQNDFEFPVFEEYPSLRKIKEGLYAAGALFVSMTGSGSTIYGIFNKTGLPTVTFPHTQQTAIQ